jgi:cytochrome b561
LIITFLDKGAIGEHPLHLETGALLVGAVISTWLVSKNIKGTSSNWRTLHFGTGIVIILLFIVQIFLGLNILL